MVKIIAEIGQNWNGDMDLLVSMITMVKDTGADIAKLQSYNTETVYKDMKEDNPIRQHAQECELNKKHLHELKRICNEQDIEFMASVFDKERAEWLKELQVNRYKIAVRSNTDVDLLKTIAGYNRQTLISAEPDTNLKPILHAFKDRLQNIKILYCHAMYPTPIEEWSIEENMHKYRGISIHTPSIAVGLKAISYGAEYVEYHVRVPETCGPDKECSITMSQLEELTRIGRQIERVK